ncbi:hypothetical protein AB0395_47055 [Streptosporangium sp. NPDC051023]|uniref:hypothetical protein n=1 Tax=Streptosporangium sp. NPDC051023 TaxID=3155410 RepID=UPI00344B41A7
MSEADFPSPQTSQQVCTTVIAGEQTKRNQHVRDLYRATAERYVYVVEFTTGVVKVGRAGHQTQRIADHGRTAEKHGAAITRSWISTRHKEYAQNEIALIAFCAERWPLAGGKEYFAGADYSEVVRYARTLPMTHITEDDLDEYEQRLAEHKEDAEKFVNVFRAISAATRRLRDAQPAPDGDGEEERILLEDIAPYESVDTVTAASTVKHHAAEALINHDLRLKLDPFADAEEWKRALRATEYGYAVSLLLRALQDHAGTAVADKVAQTLWAASYELCGEYRDELAAWVTTDGTDIDVLAEMARVSYEQIQKFNARYRRRPQQAGLPLGEVS